MAINAKPGDTVRFLNSVGGGKVVRIVDSIAYVEDSDGFEVPVQLRECVVVDPVRSLGFTERPEILPKEKPASKQTSTPAPAPAPKLKEVLNSIETPDGDVMNVVLGFEPTDIKALSQSKFEGYLVNDSNYWLFAVIMTRSNEARLWTRRFAGLIEPNMEEHVMTFETADLAEADRMIVQIVAYKEGRPFEAKAPASVELKLDTTKFAKLHCFRGNTYFEGPVIAFDIIRNDQAASAQVHPEPEVIARAMRGGAPKEEDRRSKKTATLRRPAGNEPVVVDLHASELFDDMRGLSSADILNRQIDRFTEVMTAHRNDAGRKIVFIHGKGEGVLRQALMKELTHRFKGHDVQDASFQEYGYGATQVTIRPMAAAKNKGEKR
ncbi:MAG: DUF2027 domain-containing protein [Muribaculaceae bacterium]|nr:DUF2027 domain-containing protein [Muribaculaceae bacterium]